MANEPQPLDKEVEEGKIFAVISYISFLCIVTLLLKKENKFALFHGKQGLVLFILGVANTAVSIVLPIISWIFVIPVAIFLLICIIYGIVQSLLGRYAKIPIVTELAEKIPL